MSIEIESNVTINEATIQLNELIDELDNKLIDQLNKLLATTFNVYLNTHNAHWNVTGKDFYELHILFEKQYKKLWKSIDVIAERIRELGDFPNLNIDSLYNNSAIDTIEQKIISSNKIVGNLLNNRIELSEMCKKIVKNATNQGDDVTANLIIELATDHDKAIWMLRSLLKNES